MKLLLWITNDAARSAANSYSKASESVFSYNAGKITRTGSNGIGPWGNGAKIVDDSSPFVQCRDGSCVSATAQILSKGKITEKEALEKLGEWAYPLDLPKVLNSKNTSSGFWHGTYFYTAEEALERASKKQMGAVLQVPGFAHMVTITPLNNKPGMFRVQDTGVGKTYDVDAEWIKKYVSAGVWYEQ